MKVRINRDASARCEIMADSALRGFDIALRGRPVKYEQTPTRLQLASRVAASVFGGFGFVWGSVALGTVLGMAAGLDYEDALGLVYLVAFLVFVAAFCWAFVARSHVVVWSVLVGGGATMTLLAWLGQRALM